MGFKHHVTNICSRTNKILTFLIKTANFLSSERRSPHFIQKFCEILISILPINMNVSWKKKRIRNLFWLKAPKTVYDGFVFWVTLAQFPIKTDFSRRNVSLDWWIVKGYIMTMRSYNYALNVRLISHLHIAFGKVRKLSGISIPKSVTPFQLTEEI